MDWFSSRIQICSTQLALSRFCHLRFLFLLVFVILSPSHRAIDVLLREGCSPADELEALFFAAYLRHDADLRNGAGSAFPSSVLDAAKIDALPDRLPDLAVASESQLSRYLEGIKAEVDGAFPSFLSALGAAGWDLQRHHFDSKSFRFSVGFSGGADEHRD